MYDDILLFVMVINFGNFTKTARMLNVTQSTVSRRINNLETQLGVVLLRRNTRFLELTVAGKLLYERCKNILELLDNATNAIKVKNGELSGNLGLCLYDALSQKFIAPYLDQFLCAYPAINLNIKFYSNHMVNMLEEGIDLAVVNYIPKQQNQKFRFLFKSKRILCGAQSYINNHGCPSLAELQQPGSQRLALLQSADGSVTSPVVAFHETDEADRLQSISSNLIINSFAQGVNMASSGNILTLVPEYFVVDLLAAGVLVRILPDYHFGYDSYYLLRNTQPDDSKSNLFIKFLEKVLSLHLLTT